MTRRYLAAAAGMLTLALLAGCSQAGTKEVAQDPAATVPTSSSSAAAAPTSTPSTIPLESDSYTCKSILSPSSLAVFEAREDDGFELQDDFVERSRNYGGSLVAFADYGGILCQWAYPTGDGAVEYAFSAITPEQADDQLAVLTAGGYTATTEARGTLVVNSDPVAFPDSYLFTGGFWFYGSDPDVLDLIVDNLPAP